MKDSSKKPQEITSVTIVAPQEPKTKIVPSTVKVEKEPQTDDTAYIYCYILTTLQQRKAIELTQHKSKLESIIKEFFGDRLIAVTFTDDSYTLTLKDEYLIGDKRRLGRLISQGSDLQKFVKKIIYNGNQDSSGQLFRLKRSV